MTGCAKKKNQFKCKILLKKNVNKKPINEFRMKGGIINVLMFGMGQDSGNSFQHVH